MRSSRLTCGQCLLDFRPQVVHSFQSHGEANHAGRDSLAGSFGVVQPAMAGRGGMAQGRLHITQAGGERNRGAAS